MGGDFISYPLDSFQRGKCHAVLEEIFFQNYAERELHIFLFFILLLLLLIQGCTVLKDKVIFLIFQEVKLSFDINFTLTYWEMECLTIFPSEVFYRQNSLPVHSGGSWCQDFRYRMPRGKRSLFSVSVCLLRSELTSFLLSAQKVIPSDSPDCFMFIFLLCRTLSILTISRFFLFPWDIACRSEK